VAGHPVAVHAPASASPRIAVRAPGEAVDAGSGANVASCSRTTSKRSTASVAARWQELAQGRHEALRSSSRLIAPARSAPDSEIAEVLAVAWPALSGAVEQPLDRRRAQRRRSKSVTRRS
jgi:hypothetical protein